MFRIGQKVVCVGSTIPTALAIKDVPSDAVFPTIGDVYTIRSINVWPAATLVLLEEISNHNLIARGYGRIEPGFNIKAFRPVVEKKTDISIFEEILRRETLDDRAPSRVAD